MTACLPGEWCSRCYRTPAEQGDTCPDDAPSDDTAEPVRSPEDTPAEAGEPVGDVGDVNVCDTCAYPLDADVPWHARLPEGVMCVLTPPSAGTAP